MAYPPTHMWDRKSQGMLVYAHGTWSPGRGDGAHNPEQGQPCADGRRLGHRAKGRHLTNPYSKELPNGHQIVVVQRVQ